MNDPHVVALHYDVLIGPGVDFDTAPPLIQKEPAFDVRLEGKGAKFTMKQHFATEQDALSVVKPFVDAWNISAGLELLPDRFRLEYRDSEIIDRSPTPGVSALHATNLTTGAPEPGRPALTMHRDHFPRPPTNFQTSLEVEAMYSQYRAHNEGGIPLLHMAYFLLTVLEQGIARPRQSGSRVTNKRAAAAAKLAIDVGVLAKIGELTAERGRESARKADGWHSELKPKELAWLQEAAKMMIRRAGEVAANPTGPHQQITMAQLPTL